MEAPPASPSRCCAQARRHQSGTAAVAHAAHVGDLLALQLLDALVIRADGSTERLEVPPAHGLGGRTSPKPSERTERLEAGDRLILVSDGVIRSGAGQAGLGFDGLIEAACRSERASAADTVRKIHQAVLEACEGAGELDDDATAVCLSVG